MRAWYDIKSISSREDDIDVAGIEESRRLLTQVLDDEIEDLNGASTACFVGGFSMGGAMSLQTGLSYEKPLAGLLATSCYVPNAAALLANGAAAVTSNRQTPIYAWHGRADQMVPLEYAKATYALLNEQLFKTNHIQLESEDHFGHEFSPNELTQIIQFMNQIQEQTMQTSSL